MGTLRLAIKGKFLGSIAIHVGDLLISGSSGFTDYMSWGMEEIFDAGIYGGNRQTYSAMRIKKVSDSDPEGVILDSANYVGGINQI